MVRMTNKWYVIAYCSSDLQWPNLDSKTKNYLIRSIVKIQFNRLDFSRIIES